MESALQLVGCSIKRLVGQVISLTTAEDELKLPLEAKEFKELRSLVKNSSQIISGLVDILFVRLEKWDSVIRHAALILCDYFFHRSHQFRVEIIDKLPEFLELVCESNPLRMPLPPPVDAAKSLKSAAIKIVRVWHDKFHAGYKNLDFVDQFLSNSKSIDYERATAAVEAERLVKERQAQKTAEQNSKKVEKAMLKLGNAKKDIERNLAEVENGLRILVPSFEQEEDRQATDDPEELENRLNGLSDTVTIVLKSSRPEVIVTEDNEPVVDTVKDSHVTLSGFLKLAINVLSTLQKYGATQQQIAEALEIKTKLSGTIGKIEELKLLKNKTKTAESDSEESDLEDVPEKQLEDFVTPYEVPKYIMEKINETTKVEQPCCSKTLITETNQVKSTKSEIPILPYGLDLKYWGEDRGVVYTQRNNFDGHRFWRPPNEEEDAMERVDPSVYQTRIFTYIGEGLPPQQQCRARLANGQLCPRRDRTKCPIHGTIVDRDDEGFPLSETLTATSTNNQHNDNDDDEFIRDIELATGKNLSGVRKRKKTRTAHSGKIVRDRLEKKLLDKRALKRVGETLDAIQRARIEKKHGSQFVHALHK